PGRPVRRHFLRRPPRECSPSPAARQLRLTRIRASTGLLGGKGRPVTLGGSTENDEFLPIAPALNSRARWPWHRHSVFLAGGRFGVRLGELGGKIGTARAGRMQ